MARDICCVTLTGRLTKDPELNHTPSGAAVCKIRLAYSTGRKTDSGWEDKSNYVDVTVWGNQGERCAEWLSRGRQIGVTGRLEWREWEAQDGTKRQAYEVVADQVVFLGKKDDGDGGQQREASEPSEQFAPARGGADDDIPFTFLDRWGIEPVASVRDGCPTRKTADLRLQ